MKDYINLSFREYVENKILYHGSNIEDIKEVLRDKSVGYFGEGFYLTSNLDFAKKSGRFIHLFKAPLSNYAEVSVFNNYKHIMFDKDSKRANMIAGGHKKWVLDEVEYNKMFCSILRSMGYGGIRLHMDRNKDNEIIVFNTRALEMVTIDGINHKMNINVG